MNSLRESPPRASAGWRKTAALVLALAVVGLPVNELSTYALLLVLAVAIFTGEVTARPRAWLGAAAVVAAVIAAQALLSPPRIEEGHNVFLPGAKGEALRRGLPAEVYQRLAAEFDARYPPKVRCHPGSFGCWQDQGQPEQAYAFSADGIWHKGAASRPVTTLDFSDPVWLRLGFINELRYNWGTTAPDLQRAHRDRRFWMGLKRWHLDMPWFEMIRLPAAYAGAELCWRGEIMWEGAGEHFTRLAGDHCRAVASADAGKRVFGIAIAPDTLAMNLVPPWRVRLLQFAQGAFVLAGACGLILMLVRVRPRPAMLAFLLIGLAVLVIAIDDASFLGGVRPFDGGDDGLYYDGVGRIILRHLLAGDLWEFLRGGESVYYYGGPGLRYFRALEHVVFGESYLGYLSLILLMPFAVLGLFRRFLPDMWALTLALIFVAVPVGALFGTTFVDYAKWAGRGFADPAAYILFLCGLLPIIGARPGGPNARFDSAFFGALLLALGIFMKPIVAPACAVILGGAGLAALYRRQWPRLAGLCVGFLPVFSMALHNWVFGQVFVLFSSNSRDANLLVMPPSAYAAAAYDLAHLDFSGPARVFTQLAHWLSGPAESYATIPLNAAGVAILIYVVLRGRQFDPWLRLIGGAALAQHAVALFYNAAIARYHFLAWFLTLLVAMVWLHGVGAGWFAKRYPALAERIAAHPLRIRLASGLAHLQKSAA
jgi:hypothetical protein